MSLIAVVVFVSSLAADARAGTVLLEPHVAEDGVYMASSSWVVSARNP
jgi:hypothetical protein